jgi:CLIP-associating protein 1/2
MRRYKFNITLARLMNSRMMATLDTTQQRLLEMDPGNPNSPKKADPVVVRPGLGFSKSTTGPPKLSLRETMLAQKKAAMAAKNTPARPGSAMSAFSPVRTVSNSSTASIASVTSDALTARSRPEPSATISHGGLSVAPVRPGKIRPRPELARPATAGPYSVRRPTHAATGSTTESIISPSTTRMKATLPTTTNNPGSPSKRIIPRPNTSHSSHASQSSHNSPSKDKPAVSRIPISPRHSPRSSRSANTYVSSPSKADEDFTMVIPTVSAISEPSINVEMMRSSKDALPTPAKSLKVYEDPFSGAGDQTTSKPMFSAPVLEEVPINEDAANLGLISATPKMTDVSPELSKQNSRLLDSGIARVKAKSLDVHGFRKLQGLIRENKALWTEHKFEELLLGLFEYLEAPLLSLPPEKVQDVKAQILATIKLMLKKDREAFEPHVSRGLQSLLATRSCYDSRAHIVSGLELLADELVTLANPEETTTTITNLLQGEEMTQEGCRTLSMGLHVLKELLDATMSFVPTDAEMSNIGRLAMRCLHSSESGVRMDAVQLCVAMHARVGDKKFWVVMEGVEDDPKSLITYYIVKRQRETAAV